MSKITKDQVLEIYYSCDSTKDLSERFSISSPQILGIKRKRYHKNILKDIQEPPGFNHNARRKPLTDETVKEIFIFSGTIKQFKEKFDISITAVRNIKNRITYENITKNMENPGEIIIHKFTWDQVREIYISKESAKILAERYNVSTTTIYDIRNGKTRNWK